MLLIANSVWLAIGVVTLLVVFAIVLFCQWRIVRRVRRQEKREEFEQFMTNQDNVRKLLLDLFTTAGLEKEQAEKIIDEEWNRPLTNRERFEIDTYDSKVNLETWYHRHKKKFV